MVAAVHAGWRGTQKRIAANMVAAFLAQGVRLEEIVVVMGPSIAACCFKVKEPVFTLLHDTFPKNHALSVATSGGGEVDLRALNREICVDSGVLPENIQTIEHCTCCDERYFSYRRDNTLKARQASLIGLC